MHDLGQAAINRGSAGQEKMACDYGNARNAVERDVVRRPSLVGAAKMAAGALNEARQNSAILNQMLIKLRGSVPEAKNEIGGATPTRQDESIVTLSNDLGAALMREMNVMQGMLGELQSVLGEL